jgi:hypothetical protein
MLVIGIEMADDAVIPPEVTGAISDGTALISLLSVLEAKGDIKDSTTLFPLTGVPPYWQSSVAQNGTVGEIYSFLFYAEGTPKPKYDLYAGTLPNGLELTPDGVLTGIPDLAGTFIITIRAFNGFLPDILRQRTIVIAPAEVVIPPSLDKIYGTGTGFDTRSNINIGTAEDGAGQRLAVKILASTSSALVSVRFAQRGGPIYSWGNGGTTTVTIQGDDGSGHPNGTVLGKGTITPGNPSSGWETFNAVNLSPQPVLTKGKIYYAVFENPDPKNNISVNLVYLFIKTVPRQPRYKDSEFGVLITRGAWGEMDSGHLPQIDFAYANGVHDGQGYIGAMIDKWGSIGGAAMIRESFTVSGGNKVIKSLAARVRRTSGNGPLTLTLETSAGVVIESVSVPAVNIPVVAPGNDNGGAVWAKANLTTPRTLVNGTGYNMRLSSTGAVYSTFPIQAGGSKGLASWTFTDGHAEKTVNGSTWEDMYLWDRQNLQWYADLVDQPV